MQSSSWPTFEEDDRLCGHLENMADIFPDCGETLMVDFWITPICRKHVVMSIPSTQSANFLMGNMWVIDN